MKDINTKTVTVKEFCQKYNEADAEKQCDLLNEIMDVYYIPYEMKVTLCKKIVDTTYYDKTEKDGKETKKLHINSPSEYMLYCLNLVDRYTKLKIDFKNSLEEFNLLNQRVLDLIVNKIPEREVKEFRMILDMIENDVMQNEYEPHAFISKQVERFGSLVGEVLKPFVGELEETFKDLDKGDLQILMDYLKSAEF